jgi:hypothetical protein
MSEDELGSGTNGRKTKTYGPARAHTLTEALALLMVDTYDKEEPTTTNHPR